MNLDDSMRTRKCSRVIVINRNREALLLKYKDNRPVDPSRPDLLEYWATPGGGVKTGEEFEAAAKRELIEEIGLSTDIGPWVWTRRCRLRPKDELISYTERYFVVQLDLGRVQTKQRGNEAILDFRWWSLDEIKNSNEIFLPLGFKELVGPIMRGVIPATPIEIDVSGKER